VLQGTIQISWEDDYGKTHTYELEEAKYTPLGDINVITVCKLGEKFGAGDEMFNSYEDGTWMKTNALPELYDNASNSTLSPIAPS
jgi:hypothetical protein